MYEVKQFDKDSKMVKKFVQLEYKMYKNDEDWVPMLKGDTKKTLKGKDNPLFENGEQVFFMVYKDNEAVGRVLVGIDEELNRIRGFKQGYFSMFECTDDIDACTKLMDAACDWLDEKGMNRVIGPLSPSNGDDRKGFVIEGDGPPVLLNAYTKDYYPKLIEKYGFAKNDDHYAYWIDVRKFTLKRHERVCEYAKKRGGFRVDRMNPKDIENDAKDIKQILDKSVPEEWDYLTAPSLTAVTKEFKELQTFYTGRFCFIARIGDKPVGFFVALPDYNEVLKRMNGRILPVGWAKFLYYKRKIKGARAMIQMVDEEYRNLGINHAMFVEFFKDLMETKTYYIEASCIDEENMTSRIGVEKFGGKIYRTYRTYQYNIGEKKKA